jgi:hypothetical protein
MTVATKQEIYATYQKQLNKAFQELDATEEQPYFFFLVAQILYEILDCIKKMPHSSSTQSE